MALDELKVAGGLLVVTVYDHFEADTLVVLEALQTGGVQGSDVDENVLVLTIRLDETEAFFGVEPFNGAFETLLAGGVGLGIH